jgi:hypothetical protein
MSVPEIQELSMKSMMDQPFMKHTNLPQWAIDANGGKAPVGKAKYKVLGEIFSGLG